MSSMVLALALAAGGCKNSNLTFQSINPPTGKIGGSEEVRIIGTGFEKLGNLSDVRFGGRAATNVGVQGDTAIVLTTPEGREDDVNHPIDVTLLTSDGRSIILRGAFTYRPAPGGSGTQGPNDDLRRRL